MLLKKMLLFIFVLVVGFAQAQEISGIWTGNYDKQLLIPHPQKVVTELFLYNDSLITGTTHLYYRNGNYEHYKITGVFHKADSSVFFKEDSTIAVSFKDYSTGNYTMKLSVRENNMNLTGKWRDNTKGIFRTPASGVFFSKEINRVVAPKDSSLNTKVDDVLLRNTNIQSLIEIKAGERDSIKIEIYDNGIIDGDSVSVYYNDSLVLHKKAISVKPLVFYLQVKKDDPISKLKLIAESLGSIPPCTALMVVTTKLKRYDVHLSGNFTENAVVEFFQKE